MLKLMPTFVLVLLAGPVLAEDYAGPKELVEAIYRPLLEGREQGELNGFYTERLKGLFETHAQELAANAGLMPDGAPQVHFNPFIDSDKPLIYDLQISEPTIVGDDALVSVKFHNFDHPTLLAINAKKEGNGWKVDDVASTGADEHWLLSWLLTYNLYDN